MLQKKPEFLTPITINDLANEAMSPDYNAASFKRNVKRFFESNSLENGLACAYIDLPFAKKLNLDIQNDAKSYVNALVCAEARAKCNLKNISYIEAKNITRQQYQELYLLCKGYVNSTLKNENQIKLGKAVYDSVYMFYHYQYMQNMWGPVAREGFYEEAMKCNDKRILNNLCLELSGYPLSGEVVSKHFDAYKHIANGTFTEEDKKELFGALTEAYKQDFDSFMSPELLKQMINHEKEQCLYAIMEEIATFNKSNISFTVNNHGELMANGVAFAEALPEQIVTFGVGSIHNHNNYMDRSVLDYCRDKGISLLNPNSPDSKSFVFVRNGKEAEFNGTLKDLQPAKSKMDIEMSMF